MMNDGPGGGTFVLTLILVLLVVVPLVVWVTMRVAGGRGTDPSAERILRERLARGEITEDDYESRRSTLGMR